MASSLAVAFYSFRTRVGFVPEAELSVSTPLHVYGLVANPQRQFAFGPETRWQSWLPTNVDGQKHPAARILTERFLKLQRAVLKSVVRHAGRPDTDWPVLQTNLSAEQQDALRTIHSRADWVITVDRNAGVEFFDSPRANSCGMRLNCWSGRREA